MRNKLKSRKFWMAVASFLGSIGVSITGLMSANEKVVMVGTICMILSTAIYQTCESIVDAAHKNDISVKEDTADGQTDNAGDSESEGQGE